MRRIFWLGVVLSLFMFGIGCGETFRPIIIPSPPLFPNPRAAHTVISINDNAAPAGQVEVVPGTAMVIDVSGDSNQSVANVGLAPVFAVQQFATQVLVVNQSVSGPNNHGDSLTELSFSGLSIGGSLTVSLPPNSAPNFAAVAPLSTTAYVTLPGLSQVGVVNTSSGILEATIPVGSKPDALAVTPNNAKLYVANQLSNTVEAFNTSDRSPRTVNGTFNAPDWLTVRSDGQRVYVLNGNGVVSTMDITSTSGPDAVIDASVTVPGATYMVYDQNLNRLYIPGTTQLTVLNISPSVPAVLGGGPVSTCQSVQSANCIPVAAASSRNSADPCFGTAQQTPLTLTAVTALPDGSRAYVGAFYTDTGGNVCPQVTVIDAQSLAVKSSTPVSGFPDATVPSSIYYVPVCATTRFRFMMASAGDSTRAYLSSCDGGNVIIIDTATDTYASNLQAPVGVRPPTPLSGSLNPPQNPVFLIAGP